ncbi:MAG: hypothetical protein ACFFDF_00280 [Candidatus Odinarchaeota archaeon]
MARDTSKERTIALSDKALKTYNKLPRMERSKWVSSAIVEKHEREKGMSLEQEIKQLKERVKELESRMEK